MPIWCWLAPDSRACGTVRYGRRSCRHDRDERSVRGQQDDHNRQIRVQLRTGSWPFGTPRRNAGVASDSHPAIRVCRTVPDCDSVLAAGFPSRPASRPQQTVTTAGSGSNASPDQYARTASPQSLCDVASTVSRRCAGAVGRGSLTTTVIALAPPATRHRRVRHWRLRADRADRTPSPGRSHARRWLPPP